MTAVRWWVRGYARWIARVQAVQGQLNLFFTAMSGTSLASGALKYLGAPTWVIGGFVLALGLVVIAYTYAYSEGGVWNQQRRDSNDMASNHVAPQVLMDDVLTGISTFAAVHGRMPDEDEREVIEAAVAGQWRQYRNGINIEEYETDA